MANIVRIFGNGKSKEYLFKDGIFKDGLNPTGYTLENNEIRVEGANSFMLDYTEPDRLIYVKWYRPRPSGGGQNQFDSFPILMNTKSTVENKGGYFDFTNLLNTVFVSCVSSKEALQMYKTYAANCFKIIEIWTEKTGGGSQ